MKTSARILASLFAFAVLGTASVFAAAQVGKPAPDFSATDIDGKTQKLSDYRGKTVVLEWVNPECPFVVKHYTSGNIPTLQKNAEANGVVWISINSASSGAQGDYDSTQVSDWMKSVGADPSAYIRDNSGKIGKLYGAKTTPHMFVISPEGNLVYEGAIDSIRSTNKADIAKATNYVTAALTSLKNGTPIAKSTSEPYGCGVKY